MVSIPILPYRVPTLDTHIRGGGEKTNALVLVSEAGYLRLNQDFLHSDLLTKLGNTVCTALVKFVATSAAGKTLEQE